MTAPARRPLAIGIWSTLLIADAVLVARRVSGEMPLPLPPTLALLSMLVVAFASFAAWLAFRADSPRHDLAQRSDWVPLAVSLVASALWCATLLTQASPLAAGLLLGVALVHGLAVLSIVGADHVPVALPLPNREIGEWRRPPESPAAPQSIASLEPFDSADDSPDEGDPDQEEPAQHEVEEDEHVTQWMSRRAADDGEVVEGWLRIDFPAGQREATAHVSFCPPLGGPPEIETEDLDGADLEIRIGSAFPFGARLTVRRSGSTSQPSSARIGFVAMVAANRKAA